MLAWVPEDIFFLSILIVRGKAASTRLEAPRALSNCKHGLFHIRYFEKGREISALKKKKMVGKMEGIHVGGLTVLANKR